MWRFTADGLSGIRLGEWKGILEDDSSVDVGQMVHMIVTEIKRFLPTYTKQIMDQPNERTCPQ